MVKISKKDISGIFKKILNFRILGGLVLLWTKRAHQSIIFQTFKCSNESSANSSFHF